MKIRFDSSKARRPTEDRGLAVLYAPGKRLAFRLRWYLILLLVASPLIWFAIIALRSVLLVEAPALLRIEHIELRASEAGRVVSLPVVAGDPVTAGQLLLTLESPELEGRLARLVVASSPAAGEAERALLEEERRLINLRLARSVAWANKVDGLYRQGAATEVERLAALTTRDQLYRERLVFEQRVSRLQGPDADLLTRERQAEYDWLETRREGLTVRATADSRVIEVLVQAGENVAPGTPLMRLENGGAPKLWVYLDPGEMARARGGQRLQVRMPDGHWRLAHVLNPAESAAKVPVGLSSPFGMNAHGVLVSAAFDSPLPDDWRIDQLPVRVRFSNDWMDEGWSQLPWFAQARQSQ